MNKPKIKDASTISFSQLVASLTTVQLVAIIAAIVAILGGAFSFGMLIQGSRDDSTLNGKDREIANGNTSLAAANLASAQTVGDLRRVVETLKATADQALTERDLLEGKAEFLNRYLSYLEDPNPTGISRKLFSDLVCALWKDSQKRRVRIERKPVEVSQFDIRRGLDPDTERLLLTNGVPADLIERVKHPEAFANQSSPSVQRDTGLLARVNPTATPRVNPTVNPQSVADNAMATVSKVSSGITVIKTVTFFDGTAYQVPQLIAVEVSLRARRRSTPSPGDQVIEHTSLMP